MFKESTWKYRKYWPTSFQLRRGSGKVKIHTGSTNPKQLALRSRKLSSNSKQRGQWLAFSQQPQITSMATSRSENDLHMVGFYGILLYN